MAHRVIRVLRGAVENVGLHQKSRPIGHVSRTVTRNYMSEVEKSTFEGKLLRLIRNEIQYELDRSLPSSVMHWFWCTYMYFHVAVCSYSLIIYCPFRFDEIRRCGALGEEKTRKFG